ncbi:calcium-binding protein [Paraburkholderia bannensis]|uniref:calcium-binding protein n=1 Tax=Paraburkholderia bannensis TaxID=765414 RepID=UPI002ABE37FB|nr:calcium-binding protein [Paraburkholderia bannensis]
MNGATFRWAMALSFGMLMIGSIASIGSPLAHAQVPSNAQPLRSDAFLDSIAVNTHIDYTDGAYADVRKVAADLAWIGVRHVREGTPGTSAPLSSYVWLAQQGVKFSFVIRPDVADSLLQLERFDAAAPRSVAAVEGFNEINNFPVRYNGLTGEPAGFAAQQAIYQHVHGNARFANVPVYDLTGYDVAHVSTRAGAADYANQHVYPQNGEQPAWNANGDKWFAWSLDGLRKFGLPLVVTEFGYFTIPQAGWVRIGVDEPSQGKGVLNGLFDAASLGVTRTYIYELLDEKPDPQNANSEMHFGLFRNDHTPKPAANTIRNLTAILRGTPTGSAANDSPSYTLRGMPESGRSLLLAGGNGHYLLALWNEVPFWDRATGKPLNAATVKVQVEFDHAIRSAALYDPTVSADPQQRFDASQKLTVDVPDHVILLDVTPGS